MLAEIELDFETASIDERQKAMLRYAAKLTLAPSTIEASDVAGLKELGLADADVLGLAECVAYYAYVNRIANGLGVELEPEDD